MAKSRKYTLFSLILLGTYVLGAPRTFAQDENFDPTSSSQRISLEITLDPALSRNLLASEKSLQSDWILAFREGVEQNVWQNRSLSLWDPEESDEAILNATGEVPYRPQGSIREPRQDVQPMDVASSLDIYSQIPHELLFNALPMEVFAQWMAPPNFNDLLSDPTFLGHIEEVFGQEILDLLKAKANPIEIYTDPQIYADLLLQMASSGLYPPYVLKQNLRYCDLPCLDRKIEDGESGDWKLYRAILLSNHHASLQTYEELYQHPVVAALRAEYQRIFHFRLKEKSFELSRNVGELVAGFGVFFGSLRLATFILESSMGRATLARILGYLVRNPDRGRFLTSRILRTKPLLKLGNIKFFPPAALVHHGLASIPYALARPLPGLLMHGPGSNSLFSAYARDVGSSWLSFTFGYGALRFGLFPVLFGSAKGTQLVRAGWRGRRSALQARIPRPNSQFGESNTPFPTTRSFRVRLAFENGRPVRTLSPSPNNPGVAVSRGNATSPEKWKPGRLDFSTEGSVAVDVLPNASLANTSSRLSSRGLQMVRRYNLPLGHWNENTAYALGVLSRYGVNLKDASERYDEIVVVLTKTLESETESLAPQNNLRFEPSDGLPGVRNRGALQGALGGQPPQGPESKPIEGENPDAGEPFFRVFASADEKGDSSSGGSGDSEEEKAEKAKKRRQRIIAGVNEHLANRALHQIPETRERFWASMDQALYNDDWKRVFDLLRNQGIRDQDVRILVLNFLFQGTKYEPYFKKLINEDIPWLLAQNLREGEIISHFNRTMENLRSIDPDIFGKRDFPPAAAFLAALIGARTSADLFMRVNGVIFPGIGPQAEMNQGVLPLIWTREFLTRYIESLRERKETAARPSSKLRPRNLEAKSTHGQVEHSPFIDVVHRELQKRPEYFGYLLAPSSQNNLETFMERLSGTLNIDVSTGHQRLFLDDPENSEYEIFATDDEYLDFLEGSDEIFVQAAVEELYELGVIGNVRRSELEREMEKIISTVISELQRLELLPTRKPIDPEVHLKSGLSPRLLIEDELKHLARNSRTLRRLMDNGQMGPKRRELYGLLAKLFKLSYSRNSIGVSSAELDEIWLGDDPEDIQGKIEDLLKSFSQESDVEIQDTADQIVTVVAYTLKENYRFLRASTDPSKVSIVSLLNESLNFMAKNTSSKFAQDVLDPSQPELRRFVVGFLTSFWGVDFDTNQIKRDRDWLEKQLFKPERLQKVRDSIAKQIDETLTRQIEEEGKPSSPSDPEAADPDEIKAYFYGLFDRMGQAILEHYDELNSPGS